MKTTDKKIFSSQVTFVFWACFVISQGCSSIFLPAKTNNNLPVETVRIGTLIDKAYRAAQKSWPQEKMPIREEPKYLEELLADGKLTVGLGIGTSDLGRVKLPKNQNELFTTKECTIMGRSVRIEARLILTKQAFQDALTECEILFVTSHSRFGVGPAFYKDGKENPYKMQSTENYNIVMPQSEVSGYNGAVKNTFKGPLKKKQYVVFKPDSTDLDRAAPFQGYQMLILSTCSSKRHFLDEITALRQGMPTTAILTTKPCCMDTKFRMFMRLLYEIFKGKSIDAIVAGINEQYVEVAWENVKKRIPQWSVKKNLYVVGIHQL